MIAIILCLIAEKNRVWKNDLPSLSYRYAALKVRGCDPGDRVLRGLPPGDIHRTGSYPLFELKCFLSPSTPSAPPPLTVGPATSGADDSGGVTGGVYKARERIHRGMLIRDY